MTDLTVSTLSRDEARSLTDEVKHDAERLWRKLVELYDGGAHRALGYSSWGAYFKTEFGQSKRHGYRLLEAGRALEVVVSDPWVTPPNERQARELAPLLDRPDELRDAWAEASADGSPTARRVREVVYDAEIVVVEDDVLGPDTDIVCAVCRGTGRVPAHPTEE